MGGCSAWPAESHLAENKLSLRGINLSSITFSTMHLMQTCHGHVNTCKSQAVAVLVDLSKYYSEKKKFESKTKAAHQVSPSGKSPQEAGGGRWAALCSPTAPVLSSAVMKDWRSFGEDDEALEEDGEARGWSQRLVPLVPTPTPARAVGVQKRGERQPWEERWGSFPLRCWCHAWKEDSAI